MSTSFGENGDFISFAIFSNGGHLEFSTYSEVLESDHAAYEILDSWMQWFKRISHLNGLKCSGPRKLWMERWTKNKMPILHLAKAGATKISLV